MRRALFWFGWVVLFVLPVLFAIEIYRLQDLPAVQVWQWGVLAGAVVLIYFTRDRDDVLKHHLA